MLSVKELPPVDLPRTVLAVRHEIQNPRVVGWPRNASECLSD